MLLDLEKGIRLKIEGELGKNQTLSVAALVRIAESLQDLVMAIAKYDLPAEEGLDLNNFKLELTDFKKGSAIPVFALTQEVQAVISSDFAQQRKAVSEKLSGLLAISHNGDYSRLIEEYPDSIRRNEMVNSLYDFTTSFKDSPVYVSEPNGGDEFYAPKKFKPAVKKKLLVEVKKETDNKHEEQAFARIKIVTKDGKSRNTIQEVILSESHSLSYSPEIINMNEKQYVLNYPLRCLFAKEDGFYIIHNEQLDLIGTGESQDEAEENFNEEFDFLFNRLNSLDDSKLSTRLVRVKGFISDLVKEIL